MQNLKLNNIASIDANKQAITAVIFAADAATAVSIAINLVIVAAVDAEDAFIHQSTINNDKYINDCDDIANNCYYVKCAVTNAKIAANSAIEAAKAASNAAKFAVNFANANANANANAKTNAKTNAATEASALVLANATTTAKTLVLANATTTAKTNAATEASAYIDDIVEAIVAAAISINAVNTDDFCQDIFTTVTNANLYAQIIPKYRAIIYAFADVYTIYTESSIYDSVPS